MITLTEQAQNKIKQSIRKRGKGAGIKIGVRTTGCSGLAYVLEYVDDKDFDPHVENIKYPDFVVQISIKDKVYLQGLVVDYTRNGLNEGFDFRNPNERDRCGCGESFRV
jgi:iron-sulfur cluster assembly protein